MNKLRNHSVTVCGAAMFLSLLVSSAFGYEKEIEQLSAQMAEKIADKGKKTVAVVDFTDLEGNVTQLDKFIAEEFSVALAGAGKGFRVIDRTHLKSIIKENKLSATGLIDPETARKLGKIAGVDALVTGTLTPFGDNVRLTVKVLDSETADIIDSSKGDIAKTKAIEELLGKEVSPIEKGETPPPSPAKSTLIVEKEGVVFELQGCGLSNNRVTCSILATSKEGDRNIRIYEGKGSYIAGISRLFDNHGNEYRLSKTRLASKETERNAESLLVFNISTELKVIFEDVSLQINTISLLNIACSVMYRDDDRKDFSVSFRNIPLSK